MSLLEEAILDQDLDALAKDTLRQAERLYREEPRKAIEFMQALGFSDRQVGAFLELCRKNGEHEK